MTAIPLYLDAVTRLPGDPLAWVVHAFHENNPTLTQREIAESLGVVTATVARAERRLRSAELITKPRVAARAPERAPDSPARAQPRGKRAPARGSSRAGERSSSNHLFPSGTASDDAPERDAVALVRRVWTEKNPKPVTNFGRIVNLMQKFIDAGWEHEAIVRAMVEAPTISEGWVETWLRRNTKPPRPVEQNRDKPTGRVQL